MKFGKVEHPETIDFTLPKDDQGTKKILLKQTKIDLPKLYVGCAKWNRADLNGFYPHGTKDELEYYSTQFNSIELNATFHRNFSPDIFSGWYKKTPTEFRFFPKFYQGISHWRRLQNCEDNLKEFILNSSNLKEKLEMYFVQLPANFGPKHINRLEPFFKMLPKDIKTGIEFRNTDWFNDSQVSKEIYRILEKYKITNILVDTAGRRDILHMRLTTPNAFIRFNAANHESDYGRLDEWLDRLEVWIEQGLQNIYFFIHQNFQNAPPLLSSYFIREANKRFGTDLHIPQMNNNKIKI